MTSLAELVKGVRAAQADADTAQAAVARMDALGCESHPLDVERMRRRDEAWMALRAGQQGLLEYLTGADVAGHA